jgi:hypothetical protein
MLKLMWLNGRQRGTMLMAGLLALLMTSGCASLGPNTVNRDRFDYITAISESWKKQTLLNIVKWRYADAPVFLEVGQVISGYEVEGTISAGGTLNTKTATGALGDFVNLGAGGRYLDRPTVTYTPLTGPDFIKTMMTPFPPGALLFLIEAGWSVNIIMQTGLQSINGLRNRKGGFLGHPADPEFVKLISSLRRLQEAGALGIGLRREKDNEEATMLLFHTRRLTAELAQDAATVKQLLRIQPDATEVQVTYGADTHNENEIALLTRSGFQVMMELASLVSVPPEHVADHRTYAENLHQTDEKPALPPHMEIKSSVEEPTDVFAKVRYRDHWFWIDDRAFQSKRVFTFLMILFTLSETGQKLQQPILTIRAN